MNLSKQNKIVVGVIAFILALTVGYALFNETLSIKGTAKTKGDFDIVFKSISVTSEVGSSNATADIVNGGKKLQVNVPSLEYPGAYVEFSVIILNAGNIDGKVTGITPSGLTNDDITVTHSGISQDDVIKINEEKEMKIKITWDRESVVNLSSFDFEITLNYEQVTGSEIGGDIPGGDTFVFPSASGQLGENVFFNYDNGVIDITGSGDMWEDPANKNGYDINPGLLNLLSMKLIEQIDIKNEKLALLLPQFLSPLIGGYTFEEQGITEETFKQMATMPEDSGGFGLNEEEVSEAVEILFSIPQLKSIKIEEGVTSITSAFFEGIKIDKIIIPNSVVEVYGSSYYDTNIFYHSKINTVQLGNGMAEISGYLFAQSEINTIIFPENITYIDSRAFYRINGLTVIVNKTGDDFDWNGIINGTAGTPFVTGEVQYNGKTITITDK